MGRLKFEAQYTDMRISDEPYGSHHNAKIIAKIMAWVLLGFMTGFGKMLGVSSYMSTAVAVLAGRYSGAVLVGTALSAVCSKGIIDQAVQLGVILTVTALNVFFPDYSRGGDPIRLSLSAAALCLLFSCVISVGSSDGFMISMRMISSLLCACTVYAAAYIRDKRKNGSPIKVESITAVYLAMLYIVAITTLCSCSVGRFNLGRIAACAVIPAAAKKYRAAGGAVMGALTAVAVTMCSAALAANTMLLAAAGLICSAFADLGRIASAAAFMLSAALALAAGGLNADTFNMLTDIIVGAALFAAVPSSLITKLSSWLMLTVSAADSAGQTASARLTFAAMTLSDIRQKLMIVSDTVEARAQKLTLGQRVLYELCDNCRMYDECRANGCARRIERGCKSNSNPFVPECIRADLIESITCRCREQELFDRAEAVRMKELRLLLREQLGTMTDMLNDLSYRLSRRREVDVKLSSAARSFFERQGYHGVRACVYMDEALGRHIEIYLSGVMDTSELAITAGLCRALELDLELPGISTASGVTKLEFDEIPSFTAEIGSYLAPGSPSVCSGDSLEKIGISAGENYILLSDGMGSGHRARLDSEMAVSLAARLLDSGITMSTAQRLINSIMRVKEWEESFATLDFLRLDLFAGRAEFLKSGAAPAYLCRDGSLVRIASDSYPAGIFASADPDVTSMKLFHGDLLILATDGAPEKALEQAAAVSYENPDISARELAHEIGILCRDMSGKHPDDVTIAMVKISRRKKRKFDDQNIFYKAK